MKQRSHVALHVPVRTMIRQIREEGIGGVNTRGKCVWKYYQIPCRRRGDNVPTVKTVKFAVTASDDFSSDAHGCGDKSKLRGRCSSIMTTYIKTTAVIVITVFVDYTAFSIVDENNDYDLWRDFKTYTRERKCPQKDMLY